MVVTSEKDVTDVLRPNVALQDVTRSKIDLWKARRESHAHVSAANGDDRLCLQSH